MEEYKKATAHIPWASPGRDTPAFTLGKSLLPVGVPPYDPPPYDPSQEPEYVSSDNADIEDYLMRIEGTAIQAGEGKLVTCGHVVEAAQNERLSIMSRAFRGNTLVYAKRPILQALRYIDPRTEMVNQNVIRVRPNMNSWAN